MDEGVLYDMRNVCGMIFLFSYNVDVFIMDSSALNALFHLNDSERERASQLVGYNCHDITLSRGCLIAGLPLILSERVKHHYKSMGWSLFYEIT